MSEPTPITDEQFAAVLGPIALEPQCSWTDHGAGGHDGGCRAEQPGTYVIRTRRHLTREGSPIVLVVCIDRMIWLRNRWNTPIACRTCHQTVTLGDEFEALGLASAYFPQGAQ